MSRGGRAVDEVGQGFETGRAEQKLGWAVGSLSCRRLGMDRCALGLSEGLDGFVDHSVGGLDLEISDLVEERWAAESYHWMVSLESHQLVSLKDGASPLLLAVHGR